LLLSKETDDAVCDATKDQLTIECLVQKPIYSLLLCIESNIYF